MTYTKCGDMSLMRMFLLILSLGIALGASICPHYGRDFYKVCENVVIHQIYDLQLLCNCTVIEGYLHIHNIVKNTIPASTSFPLLREITGHVLLYRVRNRPPLSLMFPNLAVIRGDVLLEHYALLIEELRGPADLILPALKVIKRGAIFVNMVENITMEDEIFWRQNFPMTQIKVKNELNFCSNGCSKKEIINKLYNEVSDTRGCPISCPKNCNEEEKCCSIQCLGGCYREGDTSSCIACRHFRENGICKGNCSEGRYKFRHRCVDISHCINNSLPINEDTKRCYEKNEECPPNTIKKGTFCVTCPKDSCLKICDSMTITKMADVKSIKGCQVINGSLIINIPYDGFHNDEEVAESLANLSEVRGYLKISRSEFASLEFLKSIIKIGGHSLYKNRYSLVIQRNSKLKSVAKDGSADQLSIKINRGSVLIDSNDEFCMSEVNKLTSSLKLENDRKQFIEAHSNGLDISCAAVDLIIDVPNSISPWNITVFWNPGADLDRYILYYAKTSNKLTMKQFFSNCNENLAQKKYLSSKLKNNSIEVTGLEPHCKYAFLLRRLPLGTYSDEYTEAISDIAYGSTASFNPSMPQNVTAMSDNSSSLNVSWFEPSHPNGVVTHYNLTIHLISDHLLVGCKFCSFRDQLKSCLCASPSGDIDEGPLSQVPTEFADSLCLEQAYQLMGGYSEIFESYNSENKHLTGALFSDIAANNDREATRLEKTDYENSSVDKSNGWIIRSSILTKATSHVFQNLRYFGLYAVSISACQCIPEGADDTFVKCNLCSSSKLTVSRVRKNGEADLIKNVVSTAVDQQQGSVELNWIRPSNPNSPIVAYTIEIRRESYSNNMFAVCMKASNSSNETAMLNDIGSGNFRVRITAWNIAINGPSIHWLPFEIQNSSSRTIIIVIIVVSVIVECFIGLTIYLFWKRVRMWSLFPKYEAYLLNRDSEHISSIVSKFKHDIFLPRGNLEINHIISNGNYRNIFEATMHNEERTRVALKSPKNDFSKKAVELFLKEALILQKLDFTHVVRLLKIVVDNGEYMYAMEYMEKDLKSYLRLTCSRMDLPDQVMMRLAFDAAAGMAYLSSLGIIHRNLSSFNCLLDSHYCLKISGFGMAIAVNKNENLSYFRQERPVRWMAPENLSNSPFTLESDVWSYGVLLWEIASGGQTPYEGMSDEHIIDTVSRAGAFLTAPPFSLPIFVALRRQCWQYNPQFRPTFFKILSILTKTMPESSRIKHSVEELLMKVEKNKALPEETDEHTSSEAVSISISDSSCNASTAEANPVTDLPGKNTVENVPVTKSTYAESNCRPGNCPMFGNHQIIEYENIRKQPSIAVEDMPFKMCSCKEEIPFKMCSCKSPFPNTCSDSPIKRTYKKCPFELTSISESILERKYDDEQFQCLMSDPKSSVDVQVGDNFLSA